MASFVFVGTRQPARLPFDRMMMFREAAKHFGDQGHVIRTGGEAGADRMAVESALSGEGAVELYLPYAAFGEEWISGTVEKHPERVTLRVFDPELNLEWADCVRSVHPSGKFLSRASTANLARSCGMVLGAEAVVALPFVRRDDRGVSGVVLDCARAHGVTTYDLSHDGDFEALRAVLKSEAATPP